MPLFDLSLKLYRKTVKRFRPLHVGLHRLMTHAVIPLLEKRSGLLTMPDDPFWFRLELLTNRHEAETLRQVRQLVKPGMTVLDIGAHIGYYTRHCARWVGPEGRVIAFEPHPRTFETLRRNVQPFPQVTPAPVAVAETEGTAELYDYLMMSASGSLHYDETMLAIQKAQLTDSDIAPRITTQFPVETYTVRTTPADDYLAGLGIDRVDLIKMDIEGAEMSALRGMQQTITRSPNLYLIMEYNPQALKAFGFEPEAALAEVLGMGFVCVHAIEADGALTDLTHNPSAITGLTTQLMAHMGVKNLLFTRG